MGWKSLSQRKYLWFIIFIGKTNVFSSFSFLWSTEGETYFGELLAPPQCLHFFPSFLNSLQLKSSTFAVHRLFSHLLKSLNEHVDWSVRLWRHEICRHLPTKYEPREKIYPNLVAVSLFLRFKWATHFSEWKTNAILVYLSIFWLARWSGNGAGSSSINS